MAKIIAVIGSPGSGKTTVTLKLAQELYCATSNGAVIYISPSLKVPALGVLFPNYTPDSLFSLGNMLNKTDVYEEDILKWIGEDDILIKLTGEEKADVVEELYSGVLDGVKGTAYTLIRINSNEKYNSLFAQLPANSEINEKEENENEY